VEDLLDAEGWDPARAWPRSVAAAELTRVGWALEQGIVSSGDFSAQQIQPGCVPVCYEERSETPAIYYHFRLRVISISSFRRGHFHPVSGRSAWSVFWA
jgi:hypothetical protein